MAATYSAALPRLLGAETMVWAARKSPMKEEYYSYNPSHDEGLLQRRVSFGLSDDETTASNTYGSFGEWSLTEETPASTSSTPGSFTDWSLIGETPQATPTTRKTDSPDFRYEYPSDLVIRNTFLDFASGPVTKMRNRRSRSCADPRFSDSRLHEDTSISNVGVGAIGADVTFEAPQIFLSHPSAKTAPSVGSAAHGTGICRPCGFFWKKAGCLTGSNCLYCHLCDPKEKRRRHKARKALLRAEVAAQETDPSADSP
eukprot:TRINITY_DN90339_c0_g1_i1.p1 TRINITY_DN90339_c0_g1~~TRINITY_DN90339_c0_g1_i1.p1  ORF type:complete len:257 (+),score=16.79 TRINITY_DN90339_c0_g1_i1:113-883(+)